jgi:phage RecT family recombinase
MTPMTEQVSRLPEKIDNALIAAQRPFRTIAKNQGNLVHWEEESMFALQALAHNSLLQKCDPYSVRDAIINIAAIGLSLNPKLQHIALIPRYNSREKQYLCHADPMYQGLIKLATDSGSVLQTWCAIVYKGEAEDHRFSYSLGTNPYIKHEPDPFKNYTMDDAIGAYCCADIRNTTHVHITFMSRDDIIKARNASEMIKKALKDERAITGPWADWEDEMWKKTVLKRAQKMWPKGSGRLETAVHLANIAEGYIEPKADDIVIPPKRVKTITEDQAKELRYLCRVAKMRVERVYKAYDITTMEQLPFEDYEGCKKRCMMAKLTGELKNADSETQVYADDYGLTYAELEGFGAEHKTKAKLLTRRPADG